MIPDFSKIKEYIIYVIIFIFTSFVCITGLINYYYYNIKFITKDKQKPITVYDNAEQSFVTVSVCFICLFIFYILIKEQYIKPLISSKLSSFNPAILSKL